jgi:RNA polymerase sigma-B factor
MNASQFASGAALDTAPGRPTKTLFHHLRASNDPRIREELVKRFLPLARMLAARYTNPYEPFEDVLQVATVGLLGAVDRFDPNRDNGFASFAVPTIVGELKRYFRDTGWAAHVPRKAKELALSVGQASRQLSARTGRPPRVEELAQYLELDIQHVLIGLDGARAHYSISLDAPSKTVRDDHETQPLGSSLGADDERIGLVETSASVSAALRRLPFMERKALRLRVQEDLTQREVALRLGCSQMQVSRLLKRAAKRVHASMELNLTDQ